MKELKVSAIKEGTVIDHIPSDVVFKVVDVLNLENTEQSVMVASNLQSKAGSKGIIKVAGKSITKEEADKISILAPNATLNTIEDYSVSKKEQLELPESVTNVIKCSNPKCITNHDDVQTLFDFISKKEVKVRCHYCERSMDKSEIEVL